jgi:alpha-tubulin suppressor-like RCC1 family protein
VENWQNITAVAAGANHTVGLRADGTVVAAGDNRKGQCAVGNWENVVAITAGGNHTVGLRADGTMVATGSDINGQCYVEKLHK